MKELFAHTASTGVFVFFLLLGVLNVFLFFRRKGHRFIGKGMSIKKMQTLSWEDFELLCAEHFRSKGWRTQNNEKSGADGGIDILMKKRQRTAIVQCKKYGEALVTIKIIREMYGLMHSNKVDEVFVVTSSRFTKECFIFIQDKNITLIDGEMLSKMIR